MIRRGYVDAGWGQVHYRECGEGRLLGCLHATAYSGRSLAPLLPHLARGRRAAALDTPGYGGSDGPPSPVPLEEYAAAAATALERLAAGEPADLFGYHTGAMIAAEVAVQRPGLVRRLVLMGVPYFPDPAEHADWRRRLVRRTALSGSLDQFRARWDYFVTARASGVTLERGFESFVDELCAFPREWWAHEALFGYRAQDRLPLLRCPTLVLNPVTPLAEASRAAAAAIPGAVLREVPAPPAPFDNAAGLVAQAVADFLG